MAGLPQTHSFPRNSASGPAWMLLGSLMFMMWRRDLGTDSIEILIHEIKPGLDFCSLLTFNDGAARRQDLELCWSRFV